MQWPLQFTQLFKHFSGVDVIILSRVEERRLTFLYISGRLGFGLYSVAGRKQMKNSRQGMWHMTVRSLEEGGAVGPLEGLTLFQAKVKGSFTSQLQKRPLNAYCWTDTD